MKDSAQPQLSALSIRSLNEHERQSIQDALNHYIETQPNKAWSQKVILADMLDGLLWCDKLEVQR